MLYKCPVLCLFVLVEFTDNQNYEFWIYYNKIIQATSLAHLYIKYTEKKIQIYWRPSNKFTNEIGCIHTYLYPKSVCVSVSKYVFFFVCVLKSWFIVGTCKMVDKRDNNNNKTTATAAAVTLKLPNIRNSLR